METLRPKVLFLANDMHAWIGSIEQHLAEANDFAKLWTNGLVDFDYQLIETSFTSIPYKEFARYIDPITKNEVVVVSIDTDWYRANITPLGAGFDVTHFLVRDPDFHGNGALALMSWGDTGKPARIEQYVQFENVPLGYEGKPMDMVAKLVLHELSHYLWWVDSNGYDPTHDYDYGWNGKPVDFKQTYMTLNVNNVAHNLALKRKAQAPQEIIRMEIYQVEGEATLVLKNFSGNFWEIATTPAQWSKVKVMFGLQDGKIYQKVTRAEVNSKLIGRIDDKVAQNFQILK